MAEEFDPYYRWLGIPPKDQPPHHYRLLGIEVFESERDVIDSAANRIMAYLKDLAVGDDTGHSQRLLNEIAQARLCLLNKNKKAAYDRELLAELERLQPAVPEPPQRSTPLNAAPPAALPTPAAAAPIPLVTVAPGEKPYHRVHQRSKVIYLVGAVAIGAAGLLLVAVLFFVSRGKDVQDVARRPRVEGESERMQPAQPSGSGAGITQPGTTATPQADPPGGTESPPGAGESPNPGGSSETGESERSAGTTDLPPPATSGGTDTTPSPDAAGPGTDAPVHVLSFRAPLSAAVLKGTRQVASANRVFTAETWIRSDVQTSGLEVMGTFIPRGILAHQPNASGWDVSLLVSPTGLGGLALRFGGADEPQGRGISGYSKAPIAGWHHVAVCKEEQGLMSGYLDGQRVWQTPWQGGTDPEVGDFRIGAAPSFTPRSFRGIMRALRLSRICRYTENFSPPPRYVFEKDADTLVLLDFDHPQPGRISDLSGNDHDGDLVNVAWARQVGETLVDVLPASAAGPVVVRPPGTLLPPSEPTNVMPPNPDSEPAAPETTAVPAPNATVKSPVPDKASLDAAAEKIREIFGDRINDAKLSREKVLLAQELQRLARETQDDPNSRFALLERAWTLAAEAPHFDMTLAVIDELGQWYDVDVWDLKETALKQILPLATSRDAAAVFAESVVELAEAACAEEQYETALDLHRLAEIAAERTKDSRLRTAVRRLGDQWKDQSSQHRLAEMARERLQVEPDNAKANLAVGRYLCLVRQQWQEGLPYLAKSDAEAWKRAAEKDLENPAQSGFQSAVADQWWSLAAEATPRDRERLIARADHWYQKAVAQASGLEKARIEQRIKEIDEEFPDLRRESGALAASDGVLPAGSAPATALPNAVAPPPPVAVPVSAVPPVGVLAADATPYALAFSPDDRLLAAGLSDGRMIVWDLREQRRIQQFSAHASRVSNLCFSPDGKMLTSSGSDAVTRVWDTRTWKELYSRSGTGGGSTMRAEFSPDGQWLAIGGFTQHVDLCDAKNGAIKHQFEGFVTALAFSPDSKMLATSRSGIRLYDVASGQEKTALAQNAQSVRFLAFSPDGRVLAALGDNQALSLWDVTSGALKAISSEETPFTGLGFSEDGKRVMLGARSQIRILNAETLRSGLALQAPPNMSRSGISTSSYLNAVCWSVDGGLLAGAWGQAIPIWNLRPRGKR